MKAKDLIQKIEAYPFESEGGPLHLCTDWIDLKDFVENLPEFAIGQRVSIDISGEIDGVKVTVPTIGWVSSIRLGSDSEKTFFEYGITPDLTAPYHYGQQAKWWRCGDKITHPKIGVEALTETEASNG